MELRQVKAFMRTWIINQNKMSRRLWGILFLGIILSSCASGRPQGKNFEYWHNMAKPSWTMKQELEKIDIRREKLKQYIGWTEEQIIDEFGEPLKIRENIPFKRKQYEKMLKYKFATGILMINENSYGVRFYFNNGVVETFSTP